MSKRQFLADMACRLGILRLLESVPRIRRQPLVILNYHRVLDIDPVTFPFDAGVVIMVTFCQSDCRLFDRTLTGYAHVSN